MAFEGPIGPILSWEMTTVVRRKRYFALRSVYAFVLLLLFFSVSQVSYSAYGQRSVIERAGAFALAFFAVYGFAQLVAVLLLTPAYVATSIAVEKRRRTIEYLFATDLTNREIVLGKWVARTFNVLMLVLVGVPILMMGYCFGRIDSSQIVELTALTLSTVIAVASVSMAVSVHSRDVRKALSGTYCVVVLLLIAPFLYRALGEGVFALLDWLAIGFPGMTWLRENFMVVSDHLVLAEPFAVFAASMARGTAVAFAVGSNDWAWLFGLHGAVSVVCLALAIARLRTAYSRDQSVVAKKDRKRLAKRPRWLRPRPLGENAMLWKEWFFGGRRSGLVWQGLLVALGLVFYLPFIIALNEYFASPGIVDRRAVELNRYVRTVGTLMIGLTYVVVAIKAASSISMERDKDTWLSLLATPLGGAEVIGAKLLAALRPLAALIACFIPAWGLAVFFGALSPLALPVLVIAIGTYGFAVASLGVYHSLRRKTTGGAIGATIGICLLFSGFGHLFGGILLIPLTFIGWNVGSSSTIPLIAAMVSLPWTILGMAPFTSDELRDSLDLDQSGQFLSLSILFVCAFNVAGWLMALTTITGFDRFSGRTVERQSATPGPLAPVPRPVAASQPHEPDG